MPASAPGGYCDNVASLPASDPSLEVAPDRPRWLVPLIAVSTVALGWLAIWSVFGSVEFIVARDSWLYMGLLAVSVVLFATRAFVNDVTRPAWIVFTGAATIWAIAEMGLLATYEANPSGPLWTQVLLAVTPLLLCAATVLLLRRAVPEVARDTYLDGLIITLAVASIFSLITPAVLDSTGMSVAEVVVPLLYPTVDLLQVSLLLATLAVLRSRATIAWWMFLFGAVIIWAADSMWLLGVVTGGETLENRVTALWPLGLLLMACAAWLPLLRGSANPDLSWHLPMVVTAVAFLVILYATTTSVPVLTVGLAAGAVLTGVIRSVDTFRTAATRSQAQVQAHTDDLTGLANRRGLVAVSADLTDGRDRALLLVDIDRFKQINDTLGHQAGDDVLRTVAQRFQRVVDADVVISRIGGDEFALLMPIGQDVASATNMAARLHECVQRPVRAAGIDLQVELSVGIAVAPHQGPDLSSLLLAADRAMYRAKREHMSTQVFDANWDGRDSGTLLLLQDVRKGLERDEFVVYFQPQLEVLTNRVEAVEALVRWAHPQRGIIPAGQFLPTVEQTTLIRPLTDSILSMSLDQLQEWDKKGLDLRLCVNISATNLMDRALPLRITQMLAEHRVQADRLTLEITETALSGDEDRVRVVLAQLHEIGVEISIDDYGSGYSSLHQIGTLGAQELKLDREFVTGVGERGDLRSILAATVHLAHGLRLRMVAEGVESASDLDQVRLSGCDLAQGFYISPPRSGEVLEEWLRDRESKKGEDRLRY